MEWLRIPYITTVYKHRNRAPDRGFFTRFPCGFAMLALVLNLTSPQQPAYGANPDNARVRYQHHNDGNWRASDRYDLTTPLVLDVIIREWLVPDEGYAELLFTLADSNASPPPGAEDHGGVYRATTTLVGELRRRNFDKRSIKKGLRATLYGWPQTPHNASDSAVLVNRIKLHSSGKVLELQAVDLQSSPRSGRSGVKDDT